MTNIILTTLLAAVVASAQAPAAKPIPRAANGKPDFSGVWQGGGVSLYGEGGSKGTAAIPQQPRTPGPKPEPLVFQDWAEAKVKAEQKAAEIAAAEKAAAEKAAAEKKKNPPPADAGKASATPAGTNATASADTATNDVKKAEKLLGIDKVASPEELKKGLKPKDTDDLLKDLK